MRKLIRSQPVRSQYRLGPAAVRGVPEHHNPQWGSVVLDSPKRGWRLAGLSLLVLVGLGAWGLYAWANRPQVAVLGTAHTQTLPQPQAEAATQAVNTGLFSTVMPSVFTVRERQDVAAGTVLGRLVATETSQGSGQLAIMVREMPAGGMSQSSDIKHRLLYGSTYTDESFGWLPAGARAFRGTDGYELAIFIPHGTHYASVVMSSTTTMQAYDDWVRIVIENWRWLP